MEYLIGAVGALGFGGLATLTGIDRDRAVYPVILMVIGSYYLLFAVMAGASGVYVTETVVFAIFVAVAVIGFRVNLWIIVAGLVAHGLLDAVHPAFLDNPGAPAWWGPVCLGYDLAAAAYLAARIRGSAGEGGLAAAGANYGRSA